MLERIGPMIAALDEVTDEPRPEPMRERVERSRPIEEANILCALMEALADPGRFRIVEYGGELYILANDAQ